MNVQKKIMNFALFLTIATSTAIAGEAKVGDEYGNSTPGAAPSILQKIMNKDRGNLACSGSLCTLFSVTANKKTFNITTFIGTGVMGQQNGTGTTNYYGNGAGPQTNNSGLMNYGIQVSWDKTNCTKNINVDKSVYDSVTTYMRELQNSTPGEASTYPQFTPAEQTMLLFYTTVMDLTKGSACN